MHYQGVCCSVRNAPVPIDSPPAAIFRVGRVCIVMFPAICQPPARPTQGLPSAEAVS